MTANNSNIVSVTGISNLQDQHTAGPQAAGFDYQFYYFIYLILHLSYGEEIGFEVKDDVHIEKSDGTVELFQAKHTVQTDSLGNPQNLTSLDNDLWKSLSNWIDMVKVSPSILDNHSFCLVTNKAGENNKLVDALNQFKLDGDVEKITVLLKELRDKTKDDSVKSYIKNVLSIEKSKRKSFFFRLRLITEQNDIISDIKNKILTDTRNADMVDSVFDSLCSNLQMEKYTEIKERKKFQISFNDFIKRFGKCFKKAYETKPLPKRRFDVQLPDNLEEQIFIKQLLDINEVDRGSNRIIEYTSQMLQFINQLAEWVDNHLLLPTELEEFNRESIVKWKNEFTSKYRKVETKLKTGTICVELEEEIKALAVELVDFIRKENLVIAGDYLGTDLSNGHFYALSNKPEIGWHYEWNKKYPGS